MKLIPATPFPRILSGAIAALLLGIPAEPARAATFNWANITGSFTVPANWGGTAPLGTDPTDILVFGGDVGTTAANTSYIATNDSATNPFLVNQLIFQATNATPGN